MDTIKRYIQFGLDNGLNLENNNNSIIWEGITFKTGIDSVSFTNSSGWGYYINTTQLITSKEFIEAVARGIGNDLTKVAFIKKDMAFTNFIDDITYKQAIHIRDGELSKFINNMDI